VTADDVLAPGETAPPAPSVLDAERAVVGAMLVSTAATDAASEILAARDFHNPELGVVAQACIDLSGAGRPVDVTAVHQYLTETKQLALLRRTGPALLSELLLEGCLPHPDVVAHHAETVADDAMRRRTHDACIWGRQVANTPGFEPSHVQDILDRIETAATPSVAATAGSQALWLGDDFDDFLEDLTITENDDRIPTPWADFNEKVALRPGHLVVIGGRPGDGKSLAGLGIAAHAAIHHGHGALLTSLEMRRWEVMRRLIAAEAKVELDHLEAKNLTQRDWERIWEIEKRVRAAPLAIDSPRDAGIAHLRARLRHLGKHTPVRVVVVDYLQLLKVTKKSERRDLEIAEFTRELKLMAVHENVCVIALSQLNRGPATRSDKKPQMSDLRESGAIEADADTVILLNRPGADDPESPLAGELEMLVPKQRAGKSGLTVRLAFQGHYARLFNMRQG
jgi:replicative DNA helicase